MSTQTTNSGSQWYYEDHGRARGPVSTMDLIKKIQKGDLNLLDLIFKEGDKQWHPLEHYTEVTDLIGSVTVREESDWILLRTTEVDGKRRYEQLGPYNIDQVLELVDKGKATFNDHVWRTGFENWVSLGKVDKFDKPLLSSVTVDMSLYKMPRHEILDKVPPIPVKTYNPVKKVKQKEEAPPDDAKGPDLARPSWMEEPKAVITKVIVKPVERSEVKSAEPPPEVKAVSLGAAEALVEKHTETRTETKNEIRKEVIRKTLPAEVSELTMDYKTGVPSEKVVDDDVTSEVVALPKAETIEKMHRRWGSVGSYLGFGLVAGGIVLFGLWATKGSKEGSLAAREPIPDQMKERPAEVYRPNVLPPPMEETSEDLKQKKAAETPKNAVPVTPVVEIPKKTKTTVSADSKAIAKKSAAKVDPTVETRRSGELAKLSFKQRAVYHHAERKFIFYTSQRAISVATNLSALYRNKSKSSSGWKSGFAAWQRSLRATMAGDLKSSEERLYPDLYNRLRRSLVALESRAKDYNSRLVSGRGPTKELTVDDIISELKNINGKARALDQ
jgi:hypothetical protein